MSLCWSARLYLSVLLWATNRSAVRFCLIFQKCYVNFTSVFFFYYTIAPVHNSQYLRIFGIWRGLSLHFSNWGQRFARYSSDLCQEPVVSANWRGFLLQFSDMWERKEIDKYLLIVIILCWSESSVPEARLPQCFPQKLLSGRLHCEHLLYLPVWEFLPAHLSWLFDIRLSLTF